MSGQSTCSCARDTRGRRFGDSARFSGRDERFEAGLALRLRRLLQQVSLVNLRATFRTREKCDAKWRRQKRLPLEPLARPFELSLSFPVCSRHQKCRWNRRAERRQTSAACQSAVWLGLKASEKVDGGEKMKRNEWPPLVRLPRPFSRREDNNFVPTSRIRVRRLDLNSLSVCPLKAH